MKEMYFTIAGCSHYFGSQFMEKGMKVKLVKEPDNEYDREAIQVLIKGLGKCGYVANSPSTVKGESMSAGRLYDKLGKEAKGKIVFVFPGTAICRITDTGLNPQKDADEKNESN
ncbi:MAG: HIRAN domain-containing protein [Lachnospirales bacterium]